MPSCLRRMLPSSCSAIRSWHCVVIVTVGLCRRSGGRRKRRASFVQSLFIIVGARSSDCCAVRGEFAGALQGASRCLWFPTGASSSPTAIHGVARRPPTRGGSTVRISGPSNESSHTVPASRPGSPTDPSPDSASKTPVAELGARHNPPLSETCLHYEQIVLREIFAPQHG